MAWAWLRRRSSGARRSWRDPGVPRRTDGAGARALGRAGIGKTILWEAAVEEAVPSRPSSDCRGVGPSLALFAGCPICSATCEGTALAPAAAGAPRSPLPPSRARWLPIRTRSASPCSTCCAPWPSKGPSWSRSNDAQWLDPASAGVLQIALRRLSEEPVGLLATLRKAPELVSRSSSSVRSRKGGSSRSRSAPQPRRPPSVARGATRARADAAGARPGARGDGW
jgi:hypothetical protein